MTGAGSCACIATHGQMTWHIHDRELDAVWACAAYDGKRLGRAHDRGEVCPFACCMTKALSQEQRLIWEEH